MEHREPQFALDDAAPESARDAGPRASRAAASPGRTVAALLVLLLVVAAAAYFYRQPRNAPPAPPSAPPPTAAEPAPPATPEPAIAHPVENLPAFPATQAARAQSPLPGLDDSDAVARDSIEAILNGDAYVALLVPGGLIRRIVATVDNLPRKTVAVRVLPVKPVPGLFSTTATDQGMSIAPGNAGRYAAYVKAAEAVDPRRLVEFYVRLYTLFQQAYVDLGYPKGYFNDRLIAVIDHLLDAPEPKPPVYVTQPKVVFEFADPALQELSAGHKIMVRIGADNESRLKAKLRAIRKALTEDAPKR